MIYDAVIYGSSLGNMGGTGVYLRRLIDGLSQIPFPGVGVATGDGLFDPKDVPAEGYPRGLRKVFRENIRIPAMLAALSPGLVHLPAFGGRAPDGIPFVVTLHDLAFLHRPDWFPRIRSLYYRTHFGKTARNADMVLVDSDFTGREAVRLLGLEPSRIRRIYLSTPDFTSSQQLSGKLFPSDGEPYLISVGTIEPRKNISALLDAWRILLPKLEGFTLVIAGRWGWGERSLRKRLLTEPGVRWAGSLPEEVLRSAVSASRLLVYPSLYEGFGLPPLEAASAGVPFVIGPAAALEEVYGGIAAASCGDSPESIAEAVHSALGSSPCSDELREFASAFSNRKMAEEVLSVYREVLH